MEKFPDSDTSFAAGIRGLIQIANSLVFQDKREETFVARKESISRYFNKFIRRMQRKRTPVSEDIQYGLWKVLVNKIKSEDNKHE